MPKLAIRGGQLRLGVLVTELLEENVRLRQEAAHPPGTCMCVEEERAIIKSEWDKLANAVAQLEATYQKA